MVSCLTVEGNLEFMLLVVVQCVLSMHTHNGGLRACIEAGCGDSESCASENGCREESRFVCQSCHAASRAVLPAESVRGRRSNSKRSRSLADVAPDFLPIPSVARPSRVLDDTASDFGNLCAPHPLSTSGGSSTGDRPADVRRASWPPAATQDMLSGPQAASAGRWRSQAVPEADEAHLCAARRRPRLRQTPPRGARVAMGEGRSLGGPGGSAQGRLSPAGGWRARDPRGWVSPGGVSLSSWTRFGGLSGWVVPRSPFGDVAQTRPRSPLGDLCNMCRVFRWVASGAVRAWVVLGGGLSISSRFVSWHFGAAANLVAIVARAPCRVAADGQVAIVLSLWQLALSHLHPAPNAIRPRGFVTCVRRLSRSRTTGCRRGRYNLLAQRRYSRQQGFGA